VNWQKLDLASKDEEKETRERREEVVQPFAKVILTESIRVGDADAIDQPFAPKNKVVEQKADVKPVNDNYTINMITISSDLSAAVGSSRSTEESIKREQST